MVLLICQRLTLDGATNAPSTPSTMQVGDSILWEIQVVHMANRWHVQAPCRLRGCYQEAGLVVSEGVQGLQRSCVCPYMREPCR